MKSAISVPDNLFMKGEKLAKKLKMSRSSLYSKALETYIQKFDDEQILEKLNAVYAVEDSNMNAFMQEAALQTMARSDWK